MGIDFVITWVDMDDPKWRQAFTRYTGRIDNRRNEVSEARFRDYGFLRYWFRGVEKFAPWVRKIHFVSCGQRPDWLDENHPKLHLVDHEDYIPSQYLPCFNSNVLEYYLHRIPGLSEQFVYFNDDFFLTDHIDQTRFFRQGLPCDIAAFRLNTGLSQWSRMLRNNLAIINQHFDKKEVMRRDHDKWFDPSYGKRGRLNRLAKPLDRFITLRTPHNAQPFLKQTFEDVWQQAGEQLAEASTHRFRTARDLTPELFRTWQICAGNFQAYNTYRDTKMFPLVLKSEQAVRAIYNQSYSLVCLNDNIHIRDYRQTMGRIRSAFQSILPTRSEFERE